MQLLNIAPKTETIRVCALHALAYCPRLFYLEEVEELYTQNAAVFAGRRLHAELEKQEDEDWESLLLESEALGLRGKVDALRTRDGQTIPYEHKRGRCYRDENQQAQAWESDRLQILAYCYLIESALGIKVREGRIRYHADNVLVKIPFNKAGKQVVEEAIATAKNLRNSDRRPPVTDNERLCTRCSLAPVCLPEEARLVHGQESTPIRLFPEDDTREIVHVLEPGTRVGRTGEQLKITHRDRSVEKIPTQQVGQVVLHSFSQISTQALHFCSDRQIGIHFVSGGGRYIGSLNNCGGSIQRRIRQYRALSDRDMCLSLAKQLVYCRGQGQRQFLMRSRRTRKLKSSLLDSVISQMQKVIKQIPKTVTIESLLGIEGKLAALYFSGLPEIIGIDLPSQMLFTGRNRRPPKDRFNALLGFGYSLLLKDVMNAILTVGLEPALGFYHQPRSQAAPLALDLMEIFRVPLVDMAIVASVNRQQWQVNDDFQVCGQRVWLSDAGRRKFVALYEQRKQEKWKHPITKYSLTYRRLLELEVRLLEKEWLNEGSLFARLIVR